jgi:DNA-binding winged helix-turn-helix (wHTH) protein
LQGLSSSRFSIFLAASTAKLGAREPEVISEKRDFYGRIVLASKPEKSMLDRTLTFGRYRLDPRGGLMSGARSVRLTPKALALLSFMAGRPGEVLPKEELFAAVWPEVTVGDAALVTCIQELRKALGDDARRPRYIETLHRRGYRFIGKLAPAPAVIDEKAPALALPDRPSIAVLPFANMSDEADQEYFADGISEDLITGLARIHWLFVIARNSCFVYKNRAVDVKQVARELGVRYVLEGSVRRAGKTDPHQRAADRRQHRRPSLGGALRPRARRYLCRAGRNHPQCGRGDRAAPAGRGGRSRAVAVLR